MSPRGTIPELRQLQCSLLYFFYRGAKLRWDAAKTQAFDVADQLRGAAIVVLVDIDEMEEATLAKYGVNAKTSNFPLWKFEFKSAGSREAPLSVEGCPVEFVKSKLKSAFDMSGLRPPLAPPASKDTTVDNDSDRSIQDDEVELLLLAQRDESCYFCPVDFKRVTVLTDKTYTSFIEKRKAAMILFWLNVDTSSRAALAVTIEASTLLDVNLAPFGAVACHDWPDICNKARVQVWPKMIVYADGHRTREYKGVWDPKMLANSAMLYGAPAVTQLTSSKEMEKFVQCKTIPLINGTFLQTVTVGVFKNDKLRLIRTLNEAAKRLHGQYAFGVATGPWVKEWVNERMGPVDLPAIVTHKNNDELEKAVLMDEVEEATPESIIRFVHISSRPVIAPLTKVSFPSIISRKVPIIMLIGTKPKETEFFAIMRNVEECLLSQDYVCVTLNVDAEETLTKYLLEAYGLQESQLPAVAYVNPPNGHVHFLTKDATKKCIKTWLEHIKSKMLHPDAVLPAKTWQRRPLTHDYLKMSQNRMKTNQENATKAGNMKPDQERVNQHEKSDCAKRRHAMAAEGTDETHRVQDHQNKRVWETTGTMPFISESDKQAAQAKMDIEQPNEPTEELPTRSKLVSPQTRKITKRVLVEKEQKQNDDMHDEL